MIRIKIDKILEIPGAQDKNIGSAEFVVKQSEVIEADVLKDILEVISKQI